MFEKVYNFFFGDQLRKYVVLLSAFMFSQVLSIPFLGWFEPSQYIVLTLSTAFALIWPLTLLYDRYHNGKNLSRTEVQIGSHPQTQMEIGTQERETEQIQEILIQKQAEAQAREQAWEQMQEILARLQAQAQAREQARIRVRELLAKAQTRVQELKRIQMQTQAQLQVLQKLVQVLQQTRIPGQAVAQVQAQIQEMDRVRREELKQVQQEMLSQARELAEEPELSPHEQEWARKLEHELVEQMQV